jgi:hypothetical protein
MSDAVHFSTQHIANVQSFTDYTNIFVKSSLKNSIFHIPAAIIFTFSTRHPTLLTINASLNTTPYKSLST